MHTKKELVSRKTRLRNSARRHQERTKRGNGYKNMRIHLQRRKAMASWMIMLSHCFIQHSDFENWHPKSREKVRRVLPKLEKDITRKEKL